MSKSMNEGKVVEHGGLYDNRVDQQRTCGGKEREYWNAVKTWQ